MSSIESGSTALQTVHGLSALIGFERTEEVKLKARLYDAFLRFPTLKAKQNAVVTMEAWAKQYDERSSTTSLAATTRPNSGWSVFRSRTSRNSRTNPL